MGINLIKEVTITVTPLDAELIHGALCYFKEFADGRVSVVQHHRLIAMIRVLSEASIAGELE